MKIESVESIFVGSSYVVKIRTDNGVLGLGQTACWGYSESVERIVEKFKGYLIGQDPLKIEHHWQYLYRMGPFRGSVLSGAVSAVDIALWDIKGKYYEAPIWDLLGGKCRNKVRLHLLMEGGTTPEILNEHATEAANEGFTAIKFDPLPNGYQDLAHSRLISSTRDQVAAAREGVGEDVDIIVEIHRKLTPMTAIALAEELVEFRPLFYEDPIQIDSIYSQGDIAQRVKIPVANGERIHSIWEFRELLSQGGPQYVRPDLGLAGGLTHCKKIAAIAESYHSAVVTHNFLGPILTAASVHLDVSIPNFITQEYSKQDESEENRIYKTTFRREGGYIAVSDAPGLGVELDESVLSYQKVTPVDLANIPIRKDGSVSFSV